MLKAFRNSIFDTSEISAPCSSALSRGSIIRQIACGEMDPRDEPEDDSGGWASYAANSRPSPLPSPAQEPNWATRRAYASGPERPVCAAPRMSSSALGRGSIIRQSLAVKWILGTSPRMTVVDGLATPQIAAPHPYRLPARGERETRTLAFAGMPASGCVVKEASS
jgi:hypothetical protein